MSVFYRLHQDKSKNTVRSGKWYARAVPTAVINTRQLAEIMQRNCTVKKSDILAVLDELVETMRDQMQDSKRVKLDGFVRQYPQHACGVHARALYRRCWQPHQAVPARSKG